MLDIANVVLSHNPASLAYIDPGSGSAIISAIVGVFVAAGLAIKTYWYKIVGLFSSKKTSEENEKEGDR